MSSLWWRWWTHSKNRVCAAAVSNLSRRYIICITGIYYYYSLSLGVVYIYDFNPWVDLLLLLFWFISPFFYWFIRLFVEQPNSLFPQHMNHHTQTHIQRLDAICQHVWNIHTHKWEGGSSSTWSSLVGCGYVCDLWLSLITSKLTRCLWWKEKRRCTF